MLNLNDIINVSFRKSGFSGYRTEDVDHFIDQVKESYDQLLKKTMEQAEAHEVLSAQKAELQRKLEVLADKVEDYRKDEAEIKTALVSAQKLGESSIREARHKAEIILKDATLKAERIIGNAKTDVKEHEKALDDLRKQTADFRAKLLGLYKDHLTMIDAIPARKEEAEQEPAAPVAPVVPAAPAAKEIEAEPAYEEPLAQPEGKISAEPAVHSPVEEDFAVEASTFESAALPAHDLRYDVLKFDDDYEISENE